MDKNIYSKERKIVVVTMVITALYFYWLFVEDFVLFFMAGQIASFVLGLSILDEKNDIFKIKRNMLINAIISVTHLNFLNMILYIWASESVEAKLRKQMLLSKDMAISNSKPKTKVFEEKISDEAKKIDILLKIGVFLVVLSGVLFSTSNTGPVIDLFKPFFVLLLAGIFYALSYVFKTKVVIKKSENIYYVLSQVFIIFFAVALGYFKTFGEFLSFGGEGERLVYSFILLLSALISRNLAKKYSKDEVYVLSYLLIYLSIVSSLLYFDVSGILICSILLILGIIGHFKINEDNKGYHDSRIIMMFVCGLYVFGYNFTVQVIDELFHGYLGIGVLLCNLYFTSKKYEEKIFKQLFMFLSVCFANMCLYNLGDVLFPEMYYADGITNIPMYAALITLGFHHYFIDKEDYKVGGFVVTAALIALSMINLAVESCSIILCILSLILLVYSVLSIYKNEDEKLQKVYFFLQIFLIGSLIGSFQSLLRSYFDVDVVFGTVLLLYLSVIALVSIFEDKYITKIKFDLALYYILIFSIGIFSIMFMNSNSLVFNIIFLIILIGYRLYVNKHIKNTDLINCMVVITSLLQVLNIFMEIVPVYVNPVLIVVMIGVALLLRKDKVTAVFTGALAYLPIMATIDYFTMPNELELILYTLPLLVIVQLVNIFVLDMSNKTKTILGTIAMVLIMFICIFEVNIIIGLFVGVLSLIMIFIGTKNDKFNSLFYTGIISLILNIIVQLFEYWERIPWFVYTLIAGLGIIFYVTYKEFNKDKKPKVKESKIEYHEVKQYNTRNNIVALVLFFVYIIVMGCYIYEMNVFRQDVIDQKSEEKFKEFGLDENIYYFSNKRFPMLYILDGNTANFEEINNVLYKVDNDIDELHVCWVDEEGMKKAKTTNTVKRYYNRCLETYTHWGYNDDPHKSFSNQGYTLKIISENLYDLDIWSRHVGNHDAGFTIDYNEHSTKEVSFCLSNKRGDDFDVTIDADYFVVTDFENHCYKAGQQDGEIYVYADKILPILDKEPIVDDGSSINEN